MGLSVAELNQEAGKGRWAKRPAGRSGRLHSKLTRVLPWDELKPRHHPDGCRATPEERPVEIIGLPQGWALSPFLANLVMAPAAKVAPKGVFFVDDAILFGDSLEDTKLAEVCEELAKAGLNIKPSKFSVIKRDGE